ncbi:hypothetical protein ACP70R_032647 [Stipagrostis hirtigluma subsp. patula]
MGQCSSSRQVQAEQELPQPAASVKRRQEQLRKAATAHMQQPYHASTHDELVLLVSLDSITKMGGSWKKDMFVLATHPSAGSDGDMRTSPCMLSF